MAHFIYINEMTSLMHGYPVWEPECRPEVSIADVGYLRHGRFCRLFNASLPSGHPQNEFGVPEGYEQLLLDDRATVERRLPPGPMVSRSITKSGADIDFDGSILQAGAGFDFSCKKDRGAILIINSEARRKDAGQIGLFKNYMLKHYKSWYSFANDEPNHRDISLSDLVFVTGRDNTADWAVAAFSHRSISGGVSFEAGFPSIAGAKFSIWGSWKSLPHVHSNCGPRIFRDPTEQTVSSSHEVPHVCAADLQAYDQCVFLRGFHVLDKTSLFREKFRLKVSAKHGGLDVLPRPLIERAASSGANDSRSVTNVGSWGKQRGQLGDGLTLYKNSESTDVEVSGESEPSTPVQLLLAYILKNPGVCIAIVHDDDVTAIEKENDGFLDFDSLLSKVVPRVVVGPEGVGTISFDEVPSVLSPSTPSPYNEVDRHTIPPATFRCSPDQRSPSGSSEPLNKPRYRLDDSNQSKAPAKSLLLRQPQSKSSPPDNGYGKLDSNSYNEEQERIKTKIDDLQVRLGEIQRQISLISKTGQAADRRTTIRAEMDSLLNQQQANKMSRNATATELKQIQEETRSKIKDLQNLARKLPARTMEELESRVRTLERRVAGGMSLAEEKKTVGQINILERSRPGVECYQSLQAAVDENRTRADVLRGQLDSVPQALAEKIDIVRKELRVAQKERDEAFANRGDLYRKRDELHAQLFALREERRQAAEQFQRKRDAYWNEVIEARAQEAERTRAERTAQEEQRRAEAQGRLLEKARAPAFAAQIHDCRSLLEYFSPKAEHSSTIVAPATQEKGQSSQQNLLPLGENHPGQDWVPLKKKGEEDAFFVGGKGKAKKARKKTSASTASSSKVSVPLGIMTTLVSLSIAPPTTAGDIARTIEDIHKKIEWFEDNQTRVTEEIIARTEADLSRIKQGPGMHKLVSIPV
ncbi:hypothetical protein K439DRAFT_1378504 [Ramaria rubella]|nr:hypothetical protein K439DRAFT_1378504 [Ramaria rubella]